MSTPQFELFPAIDILQGACVRLLRGDYGLKTEYSQNPRLVAEQWLEAGCRTLHVIDLDGAKSGSAVNQSAIIDIIHAAEEVGAKVQVGGGIRTADAVERWLELGVLRCIIGTAALTPGWLEETVRVTGADGLLIGLDGRNGKMAVRGWQEQTEISMIDLAKSCSDAGLQWALVTDVDKDGTLSGTNLALAKEIQDASGLHVIASGGVSSLDDVLAAQKLGLAGAIAGRALYDGRLDLTKALAALEAVS